MQCHLLEHYEEAYKAAQVALQLVPACCSSFLAVHETMSAVRQGADVDSPVPLSLRAHPIRSLSIGRRITEGGTGRRQLSLPN